MYEKQGRVASLWGKIQDFGVDGTVMILFKSSGCIFYLYVNTLSSQNMNKEQLRSMQGPIKEKYKAQPEAAVITLRARGNLLDGIACSVETGKALVEAGLHQATGGSGLQVCSGDMLLQALVACAGVTLRAVATSLELQIHGGELSAEGDLDFKGTLGVSKDSPVGFKNIRLNFALDTTASPEQLETLLKLTERYCVVYQTLSRGPALKTAITKQA
jgi:uncharacterized OsmC-like protein